ncbi:alpha-mannosidase [Oceanobacillus salinisoli]|uniref:alpha-mannosidase n=1 Tax=Oceanobacillus salinisoli TaxID=2678611 RepID=UPI0012E23747|nr:alpha-mannosidase [Oceanobacillus salinisoli]
MFHSIEKLKRRTKELDQYRYIDRRPITDWVFKEDATKSEKYPPLNGELVGSNFITPGSTWSGRDYYLWLITNQFIPNTTTIDYDIVLLFDFGKTNSGNNSGFESLLFINKVPYQGVDSNHKEVFLDKKYHGKEVQLALKLWSGLEGGGHPRDIKHEFKYSDIAYLHRDVDDLIITAEMIIKTIEILNSHNPTRIHLERILNKVLNHIDWSVPGSNAFYNSCVRANTLLHKELNAIEKHTDIEVTVIGHTHIDVAWLWRTKHTREKIARSFSTVLRLMEKYPEYIFLQTQPQLYSYIKEDYPEIYKQIKDRVNKGVWEVDGGMWLEADCNIPSGESLVRQIMYGIKFMRKEFGKSPSYLWLPDVFGYSWSLPQILKKFNINTFMTTKISWNQYNRLPHDTFWWRGIDGSEVLTHFITTPEPVDYDTDSFHATYNGVLEPKTVSGVYEKYADKKLNSHLLLSYGYGDGGGGVNREMLENRRRMDKLPGLPFVKTGTAKEFFNSLHHTVNDSDEYVHVWDGEIYLEYHRGTYTSQAFIKEKNRKLEFAYRKIEIENVWAELEISDWNYPKQKIDNGWEIILRNQFHDIIPGSSIHEVYEDTKQEYKEADKIIEEIQSSLYERIFNLKSFCWTVFNHNAWKRDDYVFIKEKRQINNFTDQDNNKLEFTKCEEGYLVYVTDIPALGFKIINGLIDGEYKSEEETFQIKESKVETPFYTITWNDFGHLLEIYDKKADRQVLASKGNVFQIFEDKPLSFDAWDIDIYYLEKMTEINACNIKIKEVNSLFTEIEFYYEFGNSSIVQSMILYSKTRRIDFKTLINWNERQRLLKVAFPVNIRAVEATYDIQFGNVKRPTHWNTSWDMARFESVAHQWVDIGEYNYGVSLLNNCKYGHDIKDNIIRLTLLKGSKYPDPEADIGIHEFTYSLFPHTGNFLEAGTVQAAWSINNPLQAVRGNTRFNKPMFEIKGNQYIYIDAIKKSESGNGVIFRLHDYSGGTQKVNFQPNFHYSSWVETDLMEEPLGDGNKGPVEVVLKPYEIKTILFTN